MTEPDIKLYYFAARGRAEAIRMLFTVGGVEFDDIRIKGTDDWGPDSAAQKESPYGQLPYIIYKGKKYGQSLAIAGFFGRKLGFYGKTEEDALRQDELIHLLDDLRTPNMGNWLTEQNPDKKAELERVFREELFPRYFAYFERMLEDNGGTGYFVGDSVTVADMCLYDFLDTALGIDPKALDTFPLQQKSRCNVEAVPVLKAYLSKRPKIFI